MVSWIFKAVFLSAQEYQVSQFIIFGAELLFSHGIRAGPRQYVATPENFKTTQLRSNYLKVPVPHTFSDDMTTKAL